VRIRSQLRRSSSNDQFDGSGVLSDRLDQSVPAAATDADERIDLTPMMFDVLRHAALPGATP
jgi:hypothetical protein